MTTDTTTQTANSAPAPAGSASSSAPTSAPASSPPSSEAGSASNPRSASLGLSAAAEKVLSFDPAQNWDNPDSGATQPASKELPQTAQPEGSPTDGALPKGQPATGVSAPSTSPEEMLKLQKQLSDATALINQMRAAQTQQQGQLQPQAQAQPQSQVAGQQEDNIPPYVFSIPPEIVTAIQSEDPREAATGIQGLVSGVARGVHQTVLATVMQQIAPQIIQAAVGHIQRSQEVQTQHQETRKDFYSRYKEFDRPDLHDWVASVATRLAAETGASTYSPQFGDALAQRLRAIMQPPVQQPQILGATPPRQSFPGPSLSPQEKDLRDLMS